MGHLRNWHSRSHQTLRPWYSYIVQTNHSWHFLLRQSKKLSIALTPEVINAIYSDERWMDFMCEIIPEIVSEKLGSEDMDLVVEIATAIMDNILMKPYKTV